MASSGSFNTTAYSGRYLTFAWTETSQSVTDNKTTISWTLKGAGGDSTWYYTRNIKVTIDGATVYSFLESQGKIKLGNGTLVASGSHTFTHNDNGTKSFTAYVEAGVYQYAVNCKGSSTFTLDTIARASQPSCVTYPNHTQNVGNFGSTISIHMNRKSSSYTHTVRYAFGSQTGTIATGVTTGTTWTIPVSLMNLIPNSESGSGTIFVDTYNGTTKIGTLSCGFTATVPASVKPSCNCTLEDITGVDKKIGSPVKGLSKIKATVTATKAYGSDIKSYSIVIDGIRYSSSTATSGFLTKSGKSTVTVIVTDNRGRPSEPWTYDMNVQEYDPPKINKLNVQRCNSDGTENDQGDYVKVTMGAEISPLGNKNTAAYYCYYKEHTATSFNTGISEWYVSNPDYSPDNLSFIFEADGNSTFDIEASAVDSFGTGKRTTSVSTAFTMMNWNAEGNGMGIGKVAEKEKTLQVGIDTEFFGDVQTMGNSFCFSSPGTAGSAGYVRIARLTHTKANADTPITFVFTRRLETTPMTVHVQFQSNSATTDPGLKGITYEGANYGAFLVHAAASVWDLYVQKVSAYDTVTLNDWYSSGTTSERLTVEFPGDLVSTVPTGLEGWFRATPAILRSILDAFLPVGTIIHRYDHNDPNTMYPGTTWVRMVNTFLWGCDANGDVGITGGAKTHTLTLGEMPMHSHSIAVANTASGSLTASNAIRYNSSATSYNGTAFTNNSGGGQAHNNMPPYTQVSIWRRTG
jgi:hypothetical protein